MRKVTALLLHSPLNTTFFRKNLPCGTKTTAGLGEAQALAHAARKALVESVLPSALAPRLTTLYVAAAAAAAAEDKAAWDMNVTKMIMRGIRATTLQGRIAILVGRYKQGQIKSVVN